MLRAGTRKAALVLGLAASSVLTTTTAGHAAVEDPDIDTFATYEYRVDPGAGRVAVAVQMHPDAGRRSGHGPSSPNRRWTMP